MAQHPILQVRLLLYIIWEHGLWRNIHAADIGVSKLYRPAAEEFAHDI